MRCRSDEEAVPLRVGIVDYLNSRPLAWSFLRGKFGQGFSTAFLPPAQVADRLEAGSLDVGLIPSIEIQRIPGLAVLPGLCVAATQEARSVLLLSRCAPEEIKRLALDENSRTSAALVRILLSERYRIQPQCVTASPDLEAMMRAADAALIIGDPALRVDRSGYQVFDLAAEWRELTDLPFVFAVWAVRAGVEMKSCPKEFRRSLRQGMQEMDLLVQEAVQELGLDAAEVRKYLTESLSYELGATELAGLEEFFRRAHFHGLIESPQPLRLIEPCDDSHDSLE